MKIQDNRDNKKKQWIFDELEAGKVFEYKGEPWIVCDKGYCAVGVNLLTGVQEDFENDAEVTLLDATIVIAREIEKK